MMLYRRIWIGALCVVSLLALSPTDVLADKQARRTRTRSSATGKPYWPGKHSGTPRTRTRSSATGKPYRPGQHSGRGKARAGKTRAGKTSEALVQQRGQSQGGGSQLARTRPKPKVKSKARRGTSGKGRLRLDRRRSAKTGVAVLRRTGAPRRARSQGRAQVGEPAAPAQPDASRTPPAPPRLTARGSIAKSRRLRQQGELARAAQALEGVEPRNMGERFALFSSRFRLSRTSKSTARTRAGARDYVGADDAMTALDVMADTGQVGVIGRFHRHQLRRELIGSSLSGARRIAKEGGDALPEIAFARSLLGANPRSARRVYKASMSLADRYAKQGNPELTVQAISLAEATAASVNLPVNVARHSRRANRAVNRSLTRFTRVMLKQSEQMYKQGDVQGALQSLVEARMAMQSGDVDPGWGMRRLERRLVRNMGASRIQQMEGALRQAYEQQAGMDGADMGDFELDGADGF